MEMPFDNGLTQLSQPNGELPLRALPHLHPSLCFWHIPPAGPGAFGSHSQSDQRAQPTENWACKKAMSFISV